MIGNTLAEEYKRLIDTKEPQEVLVDLGAEGKRKFTVKYIGGLNTFSIQYLQCSYGPVKCRHMTDIHGYCHVLYTQWQQMVDIW